MENPKRSLAQLQAVELQGEDILKDQTEIVALDRRRNSNREALRALTKEKGKTWFALGPILIKMPVEKTTDLLKKDQVTIDREINKLRSDLKVKVNALRDLEYESPIPGLTLNPLSREEMAAVNQVLGRSSS